MRAIVPAVLVTLVLLIAPLATQAQNQTGAWSLVGTEDGRLYIVEHGVRHRVSPIGASEEWLANIPEGDAWGYTLKPEAYRAPAGEWRQVASWQGHGQKTTEPLVIAATVWRIAYAGSTGQQLCITARQLPDRVVSAGCLRQSDTTYIHSGPGTYYLELSSLNPWTVTVEEQP